MFFSSGPLTADKAQHSGETKVLFLTLINHFVLGLFSCVKIVPSKVDYGVNKNVKEKISSKVTQNEKKRTDGHTMIAWL